jgi:hypothetical protein
MQYFHSQTTGWTATESLPDDAPYVEIDETAPTVRFVGPSGDEYRLTGAPVDPSADTIHTVALVDLEQGQGTPLCAIYVRDRTLDLEDRRSPDAPPSQADVLDQLRSALDDILIPVYIDDALEEMSEGVDKAVAIHTVQYDDTPDAPSYVRTAVVRDGELLLEAEWGEL